MKGIDKRRGCQSTPAERMKHLGYDEGIANHSLCLLCEQMCKDKRPFDSVEIARIGSIGVLFVQLTSSVHLVDEGAHLDSDELSRQPVQFNDVTWID